MRVAVNAEQLLYRSPGGIGRYTAQLLTVLPHAVDGADVVAFTAAHRRGDVERAFTAAGVGQATASAAVVLRLPRPLLYDTWLLAGRPRLPDMGEDLVHAPSVAVPPRARRPLVVTVHDVAPALFPEAFPRRGRRFHARALEAVADRADLVVAVSHAAADEIVAHSSIARERIRVVPHGVGAAVVDPGACRRALVRLGLEGRPYVLWVGSLEPRKGVPTLLAAMGELRRRRPGAPFADTLVVLAGYRGWLTDDALVAADGEGLSSVLRQLGPVPEEDLQALYAGAALFAFPSRHEGFGLPVLEAMSHGVPVVASDIPALREVSAGAARLVPPGDVPGWADALEELLVDEGSRRALSEAGRRRSAEMTIERSMCRLHDVYIEALAGAR